MDVSRESFNCLTCKGLEPSCTSANTQAIGPQFLRITDIQDSGVNWQKVPRCECSENIKQSYLLKSGDIVLACIGATTGKAFLIRECPEAVFASYLIRLRTKNTLRPDFLSFFFQTDIYWQQIDQQKGGRLRLGINIPILENLRIFLPPLPEQRAIAHILQTVQNAIQARRKELTLERERKAALMQHLFTHGTRGEATKMTEFGEIPATWTIELLDDCAFVQTGITKGRKLDQSQVVELPYLRVANVQDGYLDLSEIKTIEVLASEVDRYKLYPGDVVLTEGGDFDKLGRGFLWNGEIAECLHQNHIFAVRAKQEKVSPEYLTYLIQSNYGKAYFLSVAHKTTNLACINSTKLKAFPALLPSLDEQKEIGTVLQACDSKIAAFEKEIVLQEELFRALLEELMSGRLAALPLVVDV